MIHFLLNHLFCLDQKPSVLLNIDARKHIFDNILGLIQELPLVGPFVAYLLFLEVLDGGAGMGFGHVSSESLGLFKDPRANLTLKFGLL